MVLILNGNSEIGANARSNLCYLDVLIDLHSISSGAAKNRLFLLRIMSTFWFDLTHDVGEEPVGHETGSGS